MKRIILILLVHFAYLSSAIDAHAQSRGGSAYLWYASGPGPYQCFGVVKNYHDPTAQSIIQNHLQVMHNNGQRRLTVMVFHLRNPGSECNQPGAMGDSMNSDVSNFEAQYLWNLRDYLSFAASIGFEEFVVMMAPLSQNWAGDWPYTLWGWENGYYAENWFTLTETRHALDSSGVFYRFILIDEPFGAPNCFQCAMDYFHNLWVDYANTYGQDVLYSGITIAASPNQWLQLYTFIDVVDFAGFGRPYLYYYNIFDNAYHRFKNFHEALVSRGAYWDGIVISSAGENDYSIAGGLRTASSETGRYIHYLNQWPTPLGSQVPDYSNYIAWGF